MSKAADKSKRASRETFPSFRARRRSLTIFRSAVSVLSGSVGGLKAVAEIVGREVVRKLRKNQFFNYLGDKGKLGGRTIVLQFVLVKILLLLFFEERCNQ